MPYDQRHESRRLGRDFERAGVPEPDRHDEQLLDHEFDEGDELDHLERQLTYTPSGTIEEIVHRALSESARREFRNRQQPFYESDSAYERQMDVQFARASERDELERQQDATRSEAHEAPEATSEHHPATKSDAEQDRQQAIKDVLAQSPEERDWHHDPDKAGEYATWLQAEELSRAEEEHQKLLDRIAESQVQEMLDRDQSGAERESFDQGDLAGDWGPVAGGDRSAMQGWEVSGHDAAAGHEH